MSNVFINWSNTIKVEKPLDRAILLILADAADERGVWQHKIPRLAARAGSSRNSVRKSLDGFASRGLLAFKAEAYDPYPRAQAAHRYRLIRNDVDRAAALADGFSFERQAIAGKKRSAVAETEGRSETNRTLGAKIDLQKNSPEQPSKNLPPPYPPDTPPNA